MSEIIGFADDSRLPELVVAAFALFRPEDLPAAEEVLAVAKRRAGFGDNAILHCRDMFRGKFRPEPWSSVSTATLGSMCEEICTGLAGLGTPPLAGLADLRVLPRQAVAPTGATVTFDDNGMASWAYNFVISSLPFRFSGIRLVIDPDKAKIPWGVNQRRQAQLTRFGFAEVVKGKVVEIRPEIAAPPKPALLEVADLYAYAIAQASIGKGGERERWFQQLVDVVRAEIFPVPPLPQSPAAWVTPVPNQT